MNVEYNALQYNKRLKFPTGQPMRRPYSTLCRYGSSEQVRTQISDRKEGKSVFSVEGKTNFNLKTTELFLSISHYLQIKEMC